MKFTQHKDKNKANYCSCQYPRELSTERDFCQSCRKHIEDESWDEYFTKKITELVEGSDLCYMGEKVILELTLSKVAYIGSDRDITEAQSLYNKLEKMLVGGK